MSERIARLVARVSLIALCISGLSLVILAFLKDAMLGFIGLGIAAAFALWGVVVWREDQ